MFRQLISAIQDDDNPHLHRVPFLLLWIMSYGLAWYAIYVYEMLWYVPRLCEFLHWLKPSSLYTWREGLFVGLLFGLMLSFIQTWLIRERYGYVPRFWRLATIVGVIIAGLAYPRVGSNMGGWHLDVFIKDFFLWFSILGAFQSIGMWRINRKAWLILVINSIAAGITVLFLVYPQQFYFSPRWALMMGTLVQSFGTGLIVLYLMAQPREGSIPKRENIEGRKSETYHRLATRPFICLWIGIYYLGLTVIYGLSEIWYFTLYRPPFEFYSITKNWSEWEWNAVGTVFSCILGIVIAIAQKWLMKKRSNLSIPHWHIFTIIGWTIAGLLFVKYIDYSPHTMLEQRLLMVGYFAIPTLFQAIPMNRVMRHGWIWAGTGVFTGIIVILMNWSLHSIELYGLVLGGFVLSLVTAFVFLRLQPLHKLKRGASEGIS